MNLTWLYYSGYWDGPLSGKVVTSSGEYFWAHLLNENYDEKEDEVIREYGLYAMPDEWWEKENERHAFWLEVCGNYCFDKPEGWKPTGDLDAFYAKYDPNVKRDDPSLIGTLTRTSLNNEITRPDRKENA